MRWTGPLESAALLTVLRVPAGAAAFQRTVEVLGELVVYRPGAVPVLHVRTSSVIG